MLNAWFQFEEWRRRHEEQAPPCGECNSLMKDARSLNLPQEIYQVTVPTIEHFKNTVVNASIILRLHIRIINLPFY